jgi:hypothetical protein
MRRPTDFLWLNASTHGFSQDFLRENVEMLWKCPGLGVEMLWKCPGRRNRNGFSKNSMDFLKNSMDFLRSCLAAATLALSAESHGYPTLFVIFWIF